jgi:hypothetical protein
VPTSWRIGNSGLRGVSALIIARVAFAALAASRRIEGHRHPFRQVRSASPVATAPSRSSRYVHHHRRRLLPDDPGRRLAADMSRTLFPGLRRRCDERDKWRQTRSEGAEHTSSAGSPDAEQIGDAHGETREEQVAQCGYDDGSTDCLIAGPEDD